MEVDFIDDSWGRRVVFRGSFDPEAMVEAIRTAPDDDTDGPGSIIDLGAVEGMDFDPTAFVAVVRAVRHRFPGVKVQVPQTVVIASTVFDDFLDANDLRTFAVRPDGRTPSLDDGLLQERAQVETTSTQRRWPERPVPQVRIPRGRCGKDLSLDAVPRGRVDGIHAQ